MPKLCAPQPAFFLYFMVSTLFSPFVMQEFPQHGLRSHVARTAGGATTAFGWHAMKERYVHAGARGQSQLRSRRH